MEAFHNFLKHFKHYQPRVVEQVKPFLNVQHLKAGDYFLEEGKVCRHIGFIEKGLLRLFYLNDGKEITNCFCKENTITTSYKSLHAQSPSDIAIQAIEASTLITLPYSALQQLYEQHLFWQEVGRLVTSNEFIINENHIRFLNDLSATERYQQILEKDPELLQRIPLHYLASYLQIAPETLSRIRSKLARN